MGSPSVLPDDPARADAMDDETRTALKLWVVLARAHASVQAHAAADAARHGLTLAEFGVLELLYHKGDTTLGEIQRRILVSSGGITFIVDRLEAKGLVERRECPDDRRARYAGLTAKGRRFVRTAFPEHAARIRHALSGLDPATQAEVTELLRSLGRRAAELLQGAEVGGRGRAGAGRGGREKRAGGAKGGKRGKAAVPPTPARA